MSLASRLLRVAARTNRGSTGLTSPRRLLVPIHTQRNAGYATETPADAVKKEEFKTDWSKSYHGLSEQAFAKEVAEVLMAPVEPLDVEIKPDGLIYLPEIKYRRILNKAFGPGGWGLAPRTETNVGPKVVSREYALVCQGRLVAIARGEQEYFDPSGIPTATESCKSNALMRCCKDLGVASELWDPRFIREFKAKYCVEVFAEHVPTKKKKKLWRRKDQPKLGYPYQES
ncbi:mitochondrial genome maintenance protein [Lentinula edodes]|uniref:Mitochondrial genome maintenance protein MGM101 n=1 Tax=Lentinula edodes TaxID=5353 RepID=A0A1Q3E5C6_LENED|nr:mitochondrial genome maintenance protein [Lentinula edodes]